MDESDANRSIERGGFLLFLALISLALLMIAWPFARPLLWATLAAIMFQPLYQRLLALWPGKANRAAFATLGIITVAVILPAFFIGSAVIDQAIGVFNSFQDGQIDVAGWFQQVHGALPAQLQHAIDNSGWSDLSMLREKAQELASQSVGLIAQKAVAIGGSAAGFVLAFGVGLYVTYFLLRDGTQIGQAILAGLPMQRTVADELAQRFLSIVRATIKGSVVVALVQGALGAITFWIVGIPSVLLFGLLMAIVALLPALGPALVWVPVAIWLFSTGAIWQGVVVVISGVAVIGMADNVLRPILVGRDTGIPDWLVLVTTLGGIAVVGLSGIVLGPLAAGLFIAAWGILRDEKMAIPAPDAE